MPTPSQIKDQINLVIGYLIEVGIAIDQNGAFQRPGNNGLMEVTYQQSVRTSAALKNQSYTEIYRHFLHNRSYTVKFLDGAIVQMMYMFAGEILQRHRLAFFSSPFLEEFQNNPDIYLDDEIYADVVAKNIVSFPIRFDYDDRKGAHQVLVHPKCHMTLGQYDSCRIPVTAPLMPFRFIDFILRNFYHTAFMRFAEDLPVCDESFPESIVSVERSVMHVAVPA